MAKKVQSAVRSCIPCIITDAKRGKKEGYLKPIDKDDRPLTTYHIDHVGPMEMTKKAYNHILVAIGLYKICVAISHEVDGHKLGD